MHPSKFPSGLLSPVFMLSSLLLLLGGGGAWYVERMYSDLAEVLELNVASMRAAEELEIGLREIRTRLNDSIAHNTLADIAFMAGLKASTDKWLYEADKLATTPQEQEIMTRLNRGYRHFFVELDSLIAAHEPPTEVRLLIDDILTKEIIAPAHEYLDYNETTMVSVAQQHRVFSNRIATALLGVGICGCVGGFLAGVFAAKRMRRSLVELNLPLSLTAGKLSEVVGPIRLSTSLDLSELKKVLEVIASEVERVVVQLQQSQQEILRSEKLAAIGQLAAGTAHEIRNPLMAVKLLIQSALVSKTVPSLATEDLELINGELGRLEKTVQNLLDFARPPAIARQEFSLQRLVRQCLALTSGRAAIQQINVVEKVTDEQLMLQGDFEQLQQVLLNLVINAFDATPRGGQVVVQALRQTGDDKALEITVSDSGHGIPGSILPKIFEPFISGKDSGTGLGLSISRQIVEAHNGKIFAKNNLSGGAVVGFTLPGVVHA